MPNSLLTAFLRLPISVRILSISLLIILSFGTMIFLLEPTTFPTFLDGIWWAVITTSTVGYGDFVPKTVAGKLIGMLLIFTGVGFLSTYLVTLATAAVSKQNAFLEGKAFYKGNHHTLIIGWNERSKALIHALIEADKLHQITVIDATMETNPKPDSIHFIKGNPNLDTTLIMANIKEADKVIITSDQGKDEMQADMNSILTLLAVKGLNPNIPCIVEILTTEQVQNAQRAGADEIVQTNRLTSFVLLNSLSSQDTMITFLDLLNQFSEKKLRIIPIDDSHENIDFATLSIYLLQDKKLLLGIKRKDQTIIKPDPNFTTQSNDELIVII